MSWFWNVVYSQVLLQLVHTGRPTFTQ